MRDPDQPVRDGFDLGDFFRSTLIGGLMGGLSGVAFYGMDKAVKALEGSLSGGTRSRFQEVFDLADNYTLSDDTFNNYILDRHGPYSLYANKSHFNECFDIRNGIDKTLRGDNFVVGPNTAGREGYIFERSFIEPIGVNSKGKTLYTLKAVIDETGNVITAFPKK